MNHLLSFTRFVSSHFVPPVLSSPFISNTFPCTDSAFLSSKEREQGSCHWQGVSELPDKRSAHISQKFTAAPVSIWLHLNCALNLNEENETNSVGAAAENWKIFVSIMFHHPWLPRGGLCCHKIAWKPLWGAYLLFWWYKFIVKRCKNTQLQAKCPAFKILLRSIQSNYRERPVICIYNSGAAGTNLCLFGGTAYDTLTSETRQRLQE